MELKRDEWGFHHILLPFVILVLAVIGYTGWRVFQKHSATNKPISEILNSNASPNEKAIQAGKSISSNKCQGSGDATFTHLPMNADDFAILIPYGLMVGGHVTPIDHQYFQPTVFRSARDTYPVYAMADAVITDIQPRTTPNHGTDYRLIFAHSCTFLYYYDLVTGLTGKVKEAYESHNFNLAVKAGEQIGTIGGQTLDFAVWNTQKPLTGFVNPSSYDGEAWKVYTANPFPYYTEELRKIVEAKDPRIVEPIEGKIDYDQDGKLIGNWFEQGSGGYSGSSHGMEANYSKTHLAFAPSLYDPSHFIISIGSLYNYSTSESNMQHATLSNSPNPTDVSVETGLVKYDLVGWTYIKTDGSQWDQMTTAKDVKLQPSNSVFGCAIAELTETRTLKFEVFPGKNCTSVSAFDSSAKVYSR